jgi:predicted PurR-regulated permease PerM
VAFSSLPPPPDRWRRAFFLPLTILAWLAVLIITGWLLDHIKHTLIMIVLAAILAFALAPMVTLFRRRLSRPLAVAGAYLLGLSIVIGFGLLLIYTAAQQVVTLVANLPTYAQQIQQIELNVIAFLHPLGFTGTNVSTFNEQLLAQAQVIGAGLAAGSVGIVTSVVGNIVDAILILMMSIYFTLSGPRVVIWLQESTPLNVRMPSRFLIHTVNQVVGGYVRGMLTLALLIGVLVGLGLEILGVPFAVLLGVLAFFMEFIPVVGVLISGVVSLIVALPRGITTVILVLIYFVIVHVIESDVVGPRVMGRAVGIHPVVGIIALLAGSELFGVWGALLAAPLAGLLQTILTTVWRAYTEEMEEKEEEEEIDTVQKIGR